MTRGHWEFNVFQWPQHFGMPDDRCGHDVCFDFEEYYRRVVCKMADIVASSADIDPNGDPPNWPMVSRDSDARAHGLDACPGWDMCPDNPAAYAAPPSPWAGRTRTPGGTHLTSPAGVTDLPPVTPEGVNHYFDSEGYGFGSARY